MSGYSWDTHVIDANTAAEYGACHDGALSPDGETVVHREDERSAGGPGGNEHLSGKNLRQKKRFYEFGRHVHQTDRWTDRRTDGWTNKQTDRKTDRQTDDRQTDDRQADRQMDGQMDNGQTERQTDSN